MLRPEFSNQFDVLFSNITSGEAPGLDEYEKSVFLTKAQYEKVKNHFLPQSNPKNAGFDDNAKRQADFSKLIRDANGVFYNIHGSEPYPDPRGFMFKWAEPVDGNNGNLTALPILFPINESLRLKKEITNGNQTYYETESIRQIVPLTNEDYLAKMSKPFKEPLKNQAWRLMADAGDGIVTVNIIMTSTDKKKYGTIASGPISWGSSSSGSLSFILPQITYNIRYVKRPMPIILTDLSESFGELSIDGYNGSEEFYQDGTCCELDKAIHEEILQRAVELAKIAWQGDVNTTIQTGQRSE